MKERVYLVIRADRKVRAAKRPQIRQDEVAIAINLTFPNHWGAVVGTIDLVVPDFAPQVVSVESTNSAPENGDDHDKEQRDRAVVPDQG